MPDAEVVKLDPEKIEKKDKKLQREVDTLRDELLAVRRDLVSSLDEAIKGAEAAVTADDALIGKGLMAPNAKERGENLERVTRLKWERLEVKQDLYAALKAKLKRQEKKSKK
jgi:hypothetical protein